MGGYFILKSEKGKYLYSDISILESADSLQLMNHKVRLKILDLLNKKPMYPYELAKKLKVHEQNIYYHISLMQKAGLIDVVETESIRGTVAKKFSPKSMNFAVMLNPRWKSIKSLFEEGNEKIRQFIAPFIREGILDSYIVVGSPDPHGPYKASAKDGHYSAELGFFLGKFAELPEQFSVMLDVNIISEKEEKNNLIIVGGPGVNLMTEKINDDLPIRFDIDKSRGGFVCHGIKGSKDSYNGDTDAVIARIPSPFDPEKYALVLAGLKRNGAKTAIIALTRYTDMVLKNFHNQKKFACVVRGFDLDGDGKIDSIELLE